MWICISGMQIKLSVYSWSYNWNDRQWSWPQLIYCTNYLLYGHNFQKESHVRNLLSRPRYFLFSWSLSFIISLFFYSLVFLFLFLGLAKRSDVMLYVMVTNITNVTVTVIWLGRTLCCKALHCQRKSTRWTQRYVNLWNDLSFSLCAVPSVCYIVTTSDKRKKSKMEVSTD